MRLSDIMGQMGLAGYAEVGLVLFLGVFLALAARTLFLTHSSVHLSQSRIPLDDAASTERSDQP